MLPIYSFLRNIYHKLPLPLSRKEKLKLALFTIGSALPRISRPAPQLPQEQDRKSQLLKYISASTQDGLEIGPLCFPIVTKEESNGRVLYVDFSTAELSREKYKNEPAIKIDEIVETDLLWGEQTLPELVAGKLFDYVIASHVIEHVPDMLGWMREVASVLKDNAILSLAIPDKRFTFDYKRDLTSFGDLVEAYLLQKRRPGPRHIFDHLSLTTKVDVVLAWSGKMDSTKLEHYNTDRVAFQEARKNVLSDEYIDVHVNIVTPLRFLDLLEAASKLDLLDFTVLDFEDTAYNCHEFFIALQRIPRSINQEEKLARQQKSILDAKMHVVEQSSRLAS